MNQTNLRAFNFALMFCLALVTAYFTLENTASTTINLLPGVSRSLPIAALVIISSGLGACGAWFFASWTDKLRGDQMMELEVTRSRIRELENDLNRVRNKQNNILPFMSFSGDKDSYEEQEVA